MSPSYQSFGRPLVVADGARLTSTSDFLAWLRTVSHLTDGVLFCRSSLADAPSIPDLIAMIDAARPGGLIWVEVDSREDVAALTPSVRHAGMHDRLVVLAQSPELLRAAAEEWSDSGVTLILRVKLARDFHPPNPPCPYSGVCMPETVASHLEIANLRRAGKQVAVSVPAIWGSRRKRTVREQMRWYTHASVDWILAPDPWPWTAALASRA